MTGLEIARRYWETYGLPMLDRFPDLRDRLAAGLCGSGSECFGYDDAVSRDHDFEPGFVLFLPPGGEIDRRTVFLLERAYDALPKEFEGVKRDRMIPVGGRRRGVTDPGEFFRSRCGSPDGVLTARQWLTLPEQSLLEAVNGEVYFDGPGEVSAIRERLAFFPEDVRRKKLAGQLLLMAQSGQYNYRRCLAHGEQAAAQLAVCEFAKSTMSAAFLLNRQYQPYYKWSFRAMRALPELSMTAELLEYLLTTDNEPETAEEKYDVIEGIAADVIDALMDQGLTKAVCGDLEKHAYSVNDGVADAQLRNMHVLAAV